ncbi:MAG: hypothetical protein MK085_00375 [Phycisphaerales bacterium]|nr:hypothetical protein [Phycisphaerales bacterium]
MLNHLLIGTASALLCIGTASADALNLLESARQEADKPAQAEEEKAGVAGFYLRAEVGANIMQNLNADANSESFKVNAGIDATMTAGYRFTELIGVEFQSGFTWNSINNFKNNAGKQTSASGDFYQVPLVANLVFTIPISKGQYQPLFGRDTDLIFFAGGGGGYVNGSASINTGEVFSIDAWTYRYQAGAIMQAYLSEKTKMGIYFRFSGTGNLDGTTPAGADYKLGPALNYAIGLNLSIRF